MDNCKNILSSQISWKIFYFLIFTIIGRIGLFFKSYDNLDFPVGHLVGDGQVPSLLHRGELPRLGGGDRGGCTGHLQQGNIRHICLEYQSLGQYFTSKQVNSSVRRGI